MKTYLLISGSPQELQSVLVGLLASSPNVKVLGNIRSLADNLPAPYLKPKTCYRCGKITDFHTWQDTMGRRFCTKDCADKFNEEATNGPNAAPSQNPGNSPEPMAKRQDGPKKSHRHKATISDEIRLEIAKYRGDGYTCKEIAAELKQLGKADLTWRQIQAHIASMARCDPITQAIKEAYKVEPDLWQVQKVLSRKGIELSIDEIRDRLKK